MIAFVTAAFEYRLRPWQQQRSARGQDESFVKATAPWYQQRVLMLLHQMQWGGRSTTTR